MEWGDQKDSCRQDSGVTRNMFYDHPISYTEEALVGAIGEAGRRLRAPWVSRCTILGLGRRWWGRRWEGWREVIRLRAGWGAGCRRTGCGLRERALPVAGPHREERQGARYLPLVEVADDDLIQRLLQLPVGLRVLLARLHDL